MRKEMKKVLVSEKYVFAFDYNNGKIGFIGIDDHSGGYPYFSDRPDGRNMYDTPLKAKEAGFNGMKTYYGSADVNFDSGRVVKYTVTAEDVDVDYDQLLFKETLESLTEDQRRVLKANSKDIK